MSQITKPFKKNYYGAANTAAGFYSLFGKIFSPEKLDNIYILKGGPGCGKSTAIKMISEKANELGYATENYFCSSSPSSYDGVIIPELSTAVLDGTAPHTVDPVYPAVCENIINLGQAWDTVKAKDIESEIRILNNEKKSAYSKAYAYLSSCYSAKDVIISYRDKYLLEEKMIKSVERICSKIKFQKCNGTITEVFTDCISGEGNRHLETFESLSDNHYFIKDYGTIAPVFFDCLVSELTHRGADITVAPDPLCPEQYVGVYINSANISFTIFDDNYCKKLDRKQLPYKIINTARFCNTEKFKRSKLFYKYADKSSKTLLCGAIKQLNIASQIHDKIESLYYGITDFGIVDSLTQNLMEKIFK